MAIDMLSRIRQAREKNGIPTSWDIETNKSEEIEDLVGVGRSGAPIRSLNIAGVPRNSEAQLKKNGAAQIRIKKPGKCERPKRLKES